jgi:hypothetical protein
VPRTTQVLSDVNLVSVYKTFTLYGLTFQKIPLLELNILMTVLQPHICRNTYGLGCSPFDRLY